MSGVAWWLKELCVSFQNCRLCSGLGKSQDSECRFSRQTCPFNLKDIALWFEHLSSKFCKISEIKLKYDILRKAKKTNKKTGDMDNAFHFYIFLGKKLTLLAKSVLQRADVSLIRELKDKSISYESGSVLGFVDWQPNA